MATRRRIGVSAATTEAARRQLMQPVPCWERAWVVPENAQPGSTLKIYKWVKTDKIPQFSEDEGEADEPLVPLPEDPEAVEGDDEMDQDESIVVTGAPATPMDVPSESVTQKESQDPPSKPASPKPQTLTMSLEPADSLVLEDPADVLDASLKPLDSNMSVSEDAEEKLDADEGVALDISALGPDGTAFEGEHDLSQLAPSDALMGGPLMDQTEDPFAGMAE